MPLPTSPTHVQPSLYDEPEATLELRVTAVRGVPGLQLSATVVRPDGSWLACEVPPPVTCDVHAPQGAHDLLREFLDKLRDFVPPF